MDVSIVLRERREEVHLSPEETRRGWSGHRRCRSRRDDLGRRVFPSPPPLRI